MLVDVGDRMQVPREHPILDFGFGQVAGLLNLQRLTPKIITRSDLSVKLIGAQDIFLTPVVNLRFAHFFCGSQNRSKTTYSGF